MAASKWSLAVTLLAPSLLLAQPERTVATRALDQWADPIQRTTDPVPGGPYTLEVASPREVWPWATRTDAGPRDWADVTRAHWTPLIDGRDLSATRFGGFEGYRLAWWIGQTGWDRGPACYCWHRVQATVFAAVGANASALWWGGDVDDELLRDALAWDDATGRWSDWGAVFVVTEDAPHGVEWIVGTPTLRTPTPGEPSVPQVPEPSVLWLLLAGVALMTGRARRWE